MANKSASASTGGSENKWILVQFLQRIAIFTDL